MEKILIVGITGAIGKKVAELFTANGINCIGSTSKKKNLHKTPHEMFYVNLEKISTISHFISQIPLLNGVIFCAGLEPQFSLNETDIKHHNKMMDIHVNGPLFLIQSLKNKIKKGGVITFISSIAAQKGSYDPSYAIAKSAIDGITRTLSRELAINHIRVNAIAPGLVSDTPVFKKMSPDFKEKHLSQTLTKNLTTTKDCAEAIYFLYTQRQITGQIMHINGGQYFGN